MEMANIPFGKVSSMVTEDETVVEKVVRWIARDNTLVGFCGVAENHHCISNFVVNVGFEIEGYENIVQVFKMNIRAHFAWVLIVNPLHPRLPRLVILIQLNCNSFDAAFVRNQWEKVKALWSIHLLDVLGPLIGHASDGDAHKEKIDA